MTAHLNHSLASTSGPECVKTPPQEPKSSEVNTVRLEEKIAKLKVQMKELQAIETAQRLTG